MYLIIFTNFFSVALAPVRLHIWIPSLYKWLYKWSPFPGILYLLLLHLEGRLSSKGPYCMKPSLMGPDIISCSVILKHPVHAIETIFIRLYGNLFLLDCRLLDVRHYFICLLFPNLAQCLENNSSKNCVWNEWMKKHLFWSVVIKSLGSGPRWTGFGSWLCCLLAVPQFPHIA